MLVTCLLEIAIISGGLPWITKTEVEGKLLSDNKQGMYLVDFSQGIKKIENLASNPKGYSAILIESNKCVKK